MNDNTNNPNSGLNSPMITGSFRDRETADRAYSELRAKGYSDTDIHVMMTHDTRDRLYGKDVKVEHGNLALSGAGVGGAVGGAVGATLLGILAATAAVTVPGIGLVIAGPLAGALAGGAAGAAAGGLVGTMVGAGIPEERAKVVEKDVKNGSIVLGVTPRHTEDATYFENAWRPTDQPVSR